MFCKNCGNQVEEGAFCPVCGASVEADVITPEIVSETPVLSGAPKVMGLIGMILGIVGSVFGLCCCTYGMFFTPLSIAGLILSIIGSKKASALGCTNNMAKVGIIFSIIGIAVPVLVWAVVIVFYLLAMVGAIAGNA